jgi:tRNA G18 (ribose-2'-O)-methylase SpoU
MGRVRRVDAIDDPDLAPYVGMFGADERGDDLCIVEGRLTVESLLDSPYEPVSLLLAERHVASYGALMDTFPADVLVAPQDVIDATVGFHMHRGVVACARRGAPRSIEEVTAGATHVLICEAVTDPENLGALFRNAAAFGIDALVLDPATCDPLSRRTIRVSMGHALRVPFARAPLNDILGINLPLIALTPSAETDIAELLVPHGYALMVGNEGDGLSDAILRAAGVTPARIAMAEGVDSLNVATAAAVAFALLRRR